MRLKGRDAKAVNAFFNSAFVVYDSRWLLERNDLHGKACEVDFRLPFTSSYMPPKQRQAYIDMFAKELVLTHRARWICWVSAFFNDPVTGEIYSEDRQQITHDKILLNDALKEFNKSIEEAKNAGNYRFYLYYTWRIEVYKDQPLFQEQGAA